MDQSYQVTTGEGAAWGGLFGGLIGALLAAPFTGGASAAAALTAGSLGGVALGATFGAIDASTWKEDYGISEDFVQRISALVQPGDSAVFVLARAINPDLIADAFSGYGGTVLRTTLSDSQKARVEATLTASGNAHIERTRDMAATHRTPRRSKRRSRGRSKAQRRSWMISRRTPKKRTDAETAAIGKLNTAKQDLDRKLQDLKGAHQAHVAQAKSEIETDTAKFKASVDELTAKVKGSKKRVTGDLP